MNGHALDRHREVHRLEGLVAGEAVETAVAQIARLAERFAKAGEELHRADAAVDVDGGVGLGVAGIGQRGLEIAVAVGAKGVGDFLEQPGALSEAQSAQRRPSGLARIVHGGADVDALARCPRQLIAQHRIGQRHTPTAALGPAAANVTRKFHRPLLVPGSLRFAGAP